jgi:GrpB-like predicted nucleotidyltransferase (UPF0157 family)
LERTIQVVPYNPQWATDFLDLSRALKIKLWREILAVEHFGSTAVPGLAAKPILDIMLIIPNTTAAFQRTRSALDKIGYYHQGDLGISGREAFRNRDRNAPYDMTAREWPTHYLYVCKNHAPVLIDFLAFRDYLRQHPHDAAEYGRIKIQAAEKYAHDIDGYMAFKKDFVETILQKVDENRKRVRTYLDSLDK